MRIQVENLRKTFPSPKGPVEALRKIDLVVDSGQIVAVVGPSGCGKTTLLRIIGGLETPTTGTVLLDECPVAAGMPGVEFVFQRPALLPWRTALENVMLPLEIDSEGTNRSHQARDTKARQMLGRVGMLTAYARYPNQLSGGMEHRTEVARAFVAEPRLLLMDEPFASLDTITREGMQRLLLEVWQNNRPTVVFVTHDISEAVFVADRVIVFSKGPGSLKDDEVVAISRPRNGDVRESPAFRGLVGRLKGQMTDD